MSKLLISLFIFSLAACSNAPGRKYRIETLEQRADEYMNTGNRFRLNKEYKEAYAYYKMASDIYFLKREKKKYILAELNKILVLITLKKVNSAQRALEKVAKENSIQVVGLDSEIKGIEARIALAKKDSMKAKEILDQIITNLQVDPKKWAYYVALKSEKTDDYDIKPNELASLVSIFNDIFEDYVDGEEVNTEGLVYINFVLAQIYIKNQRYPYAIRFLETYETLLNDLELVSQFPKLFESYKEIYSKQEKKELVDYYESLIEKNSKVIKTYKKGS